MNKELKSENIREIYQEFQRVLVLFGSVTRKVGLIWLLNKTGILSVAGLTKQI